jgi:hypothetical protein
MTVGFPEYDAVLKDMYTTEKLEELSYTEDQQFYAMVPKKSAGGRRWIQPIEYNHPGGASADFALAMANETSSNFEDFQMSQRQQFQRVTVKYDLLLASQKKDEAFQPAFDEFDRGFRGLADKVGARLYRRNTGAIAQLANSTAATTTLTLADKADIFSFQIGMRLKGSTTNGGAVYTGTATVTGVDDEAGTLTISANLDSAFTAPATTCFLYQEGDAQNGGTALCFSGLEDWLPVTDRATRLAASFNGVTRSASPTKLGGVYLNATGMAYDEMIIKLVQRVTKHQGKPDTILMNPDVIGELMLLENSKRFNFRDITVSVKGSAGDIVVGFSAVMASIGGRQVKIIGDRNCPSNRTYALQLNTWKLWHLGQLPDFIGREMGLPILKQAETQPALEARMCAFGDLGCSAPGKNGVAEHAVPA